MPNWVYNNITIQGPTDQVDSIRDRLNAPFTRHYKDYWDSETKKHIEKDIHFSAPVFSFWNIVRPSDEIMNEYLEHSPRMKSSLDDKEAWNAELIKQYKESNDWYTWNNRNWGTKWDVAVGDGEEYPETELIDEIEEEVGNKSIIYRFDTAWSPPVPAIMALSQLVPNCVVTLDWQEEQGFGGQVEFVRGEITAESEYESKCPECDAVDTLEYCDECNFEVCSDCDFNEGNPDDVANCPDHGGK